MQTKFDIDDYVSVFEKEEESLNNKYNCLLCKYFEIWGHFANDDFLESTDYGICLNKRSFYYFYDDNIRVDEKKYCDCFERQIFIWKE